MENIEQPVHDIINKLAWLPTGLFDSVDPSLIEIREKSICCYNKNSGNAAAHRVDGPAYFDICGEERWFLDGIPHREGGPAIKFTEGDCYEDTDYKSEEWWVDGKRHRVGGPSIIYNDGEFAWHQNGLLHREDGPAYYVPKGLHKSENIEWRNRGLFHRVGGPAIIRSNGTQEWYQHGERHRIDGPAIVHSEDGIDWEGSGTICWYLFSEPSTQETVEHFYQTVVKEFGEEQINSIPYEVLKSLFVSTQTSARSKTY